MNDFKKKLTLYEKVKEDIEQGNTQKREIKVDLTEEEKKRNEAVRLIMAFFNRELTKEDEAKLLDMEKKTTPDSMFYLLFRMAKEYIKTGELNEENLKTIAIEVELKNQVGDKWKKDPKEWGKEESEGNGR